ncbi:MAG: type II toxin-antitoxin system VapC family toxin [Candidatus Tisiphia sp.]|uniref:type II toxin-antitoxin system VapC family toxin n=1 Tax=Candidatus Tisiphia endosymbiont of Melanophora roralis TaxID=3066261 RepID=UPI001E787B52|nr:MAG: type II toxin-antitoxin system VapC family toxin [Rickettsia endosymbiont of Cimex lectularius]
MNKSDQYVILDASALIALLSEEKGGETVASILPKSVMSSVNIAEVAKFLIERRSLSEEEVSNIIQSLIEIIIPFDTQLALISANIVRQTKALGLSLGDRACLALALQTGYTVYSADRIWSKLNLDCKIVIIR